MQRRKKEIPCTKKTIRKEIIEDIVVKATLKAFENPDAIEKLADDILKLHESQPEENLALKALQESLKSVNRKIANLTAAIEEGIITETTKQRLRTLEEERADLTEKILAEDGRQRLQVSKEDIVRFIKKAISKDPFFMIRTLVKQVILYDDRAVIQYNCTTDNPDDDDHRGFCFHTETVYLEHKLYGTSYGSSTVKFIVELYA